MGATRGDRAWAFVTPSFPGDAERCALLVRSLDRCCPEVPHYLLVDRRDMDCFRHLESTRTHLVESEALVEPWLRRLPSRHGIWVSWSTPPVRGWIMQQIRKIAASGRLESSNLICCDSDMAFVRPFSVDELLVDGRLGLLEVPYVDDQIRRWTTIARSLLGCPVDRDVTCSHVGQMVCWRRENVELMKARIEGVTGRGWQRSLARLPTFSEYVLYGTFVREVLGYERSGQAPSTRALVKTSWNRDISQRWQVDRFFDEIDPQTIAVMAHSKAPVDLGYFRAKVESGWERAYPGEDSRAG